MDELFEPMNVATDIGTIAQAADDLVKLVGSILQEREPIRHARIMNRLIDVLVIKCKKTGIAPDVEVKATCSQLTAEAQQAIATCVKDELLPPTTNPAQLNMFPNKISEVVLGKDKTAYLKFYCPGCKCFELIPFRAGSEHTGPVWSFSGTEDNPTLSPSVRHFFPAHDGIAE